MPEHEGPIERPVFGELPARNHMTLGRRINEMKYAKHIELLRSYPRQWAMIGIFEKGSKEMTRKKATGQQGYIYSWLKKHFPLEAWEIRIRTDPHSYSRRELWARYMGDLTQEQADELYKVRREMYMLKGIKGAERRAQQELRRRFLAMAEVPEKPGQDSEDDPR